MAKEKRQQQNSKKKQKKRQKGAHNKGEQNNIIHVEHIISESEKNTCY